MYTMIFRLWTIARQCPNPNAERLRISIKWLREEGARLPRSRRVLFANPDLHHGLLGSVVIFVVHWKRIAWDGKYPIAADKILST